MVCKDQAGKVGICTQSIDKVCASALFACVLSKLTSVIQGVFVALVAKDSAAALAGLRFGDQILQINGESVAGWSVDKTITTLKKANGAHISMAVRDRPFDRTVTVVKDSANTVRLSGSACRIL